MKKYFLPLLTVSLEKSLEEGVRELLSQACGFLGAKGYSLFISLERKGKFFPLHRGISPGVQEKIRAMVEKAGEEVQVFEGLRELPSRDLKQALRDEGISSFIIFPLKCRGRASGKLVLYFRKKRKLKGKFKERLEAMASVLSAYVDNYFLFSALQEREKTLNTIFESSPAAIFVMQDMRYKVVNPAFEKITGFSAEEVKDMFFWEIVHPDDREEVKERGIRRERGERVEPELYEMKIVDKEGREKWVLFRGTPIQFDGRSANLGIAFDITEKKELEDRLSSLKENLKAIYESTVMGIYLFDFEKGIYEMVNPKGKEILGLDLENKSPGEVFPPEEAERIDEILNYIRKTKRTLTTVEKYHTGLGERFVFVSRAPVFGRDGTVKKVVGIFRDITEEERAKHEWEKRADFSMMEKTIEVVAKELNNILSIILATSEIGLKSGIDETNWQRIHQKAKEAQNFIYQLMEIGRGEGGKKTAVELNDFIRNSLLLFRSILPHDIVLEFSPWPAPVYILCNPSALKTALSHLLINAREATKGGGIIHILVESHGGFALLKIRDTGRGMSQQEISRAFEPFFSTKSLESGSGLGLTFVKKFVEKMGGSVSIDSSPGRGTTVILKIPLTSEPREEERRSVVKPSGQRVLLVEDDHDVRRVEHELLTILGYSVEEASSAREALESIQRSRPSIVITDLSMPGMGGAQLAREIKKIDPSIRILLISGYVGEGEAEELRKMGIDEVLHKPFGLEELKKALHSLS